MNPYLTGLITGLGFGTCIGGLASTLLWRRTVKLLNVEFYKMVDLNHLLTNRLFRQGLSEQPWEDLLPHEKPLEKGPV